MLFSYVAHYTLLVQKPHTDHTSDKFQIIPCHIKLRMHNYLNQNSLTKCVHIRTVHTQDVHTYVYYIP